MFRGEVWEMAGSSGGGERIPRKVVILSSDALGTIPLRVVVPLSPWHQKYSRAPWIVRVPPVLNSGLDEPHAADALQMRSVSISRLATKLGELPDAITAEISRAAALVIHQVAETRV
jgi:mRNA interferase MazF